MFSLRYPNQEFVSCMRSYVFVLRLFTIPNNKKQQSLRLNIFILDKKKSKSLEILEEKDIQNQHTNLAIRSNTTE